MPTGIVHLQKLKWLGPYRLKLWFTDGMAGEWDFSELAGERGPMAEPFEDPVDFDRVFLDSGALTWPNGFDWRPDAPYVDMAAAGVMEIEPPPDGRTD
jgi:hypothetical protein